MEKFAARTGRTYNLFDYYGDAGAEHVIVLMGSGAQTAIETVDHLVKQGEKVGVLVVRLFRPFPAARFIDTLPKTLKGLAVLDRTKEAGAVAEPLHLDVIASLRGCGNGEGEHLRAARVIGGRYGLSSKEFTPGMVKAVFDELKKERPADRFTIGIEDDVTHLSLPYDETYDIEGGDRVGAVFFGLGADGTVGANKNSIKIIGEETDNFAQGYYVYDSKKSGSVTVSHLRFSPNPIRSSYLLRQAQFVACHQFNFLEKFDVLRYALPGAVFLLNSPYGARGRVGASPHGGAVRDLGKAASLLRDRCGPGSERSRHGEQNKYDHADMLLCDLGGPAQGSGHREDQAVDQENLREQRRRGSEQELRRR